MSVEKKVLQALDEAGFTVHDLKVATEYEHDHRPFVDMSTMERGTVTQMLSGPTHSISCTLTETKGSPTECRNCGKDVSMPNYMMRDGIGYVCKACVTKAQARLRGA